PHSVCSRKFYRWSMGLDRACKMSGESVKARVRRSSPHGMHSVDTAEQVPQAAMACDAYFSQPTCCSQTFPVADHVMCGCALGASSARRQGSMPTRLNVQTSVTEPLADRAMSRPDNPGG